MNLSVSLTPQLAKFVKDKVKSGRYGSASEVVREALRGLERSDADYDIEWLREAWREGLASGDAGEADFEEIKARGRRELARERRASGRKRA